MSTNLLVIPFDYLFYVNTHVNCGILCDTLVNPRTFKMAASVFARRDPEQKSEEYGQVGESTDIQNGSFCFLEA